MKKIECFIRHEKVEDLRDALIAEGVGGMTFTEVRGFGSQTTRPKNYLVLPKVKIEIYANDADVERFVETIVTTCRDQKLGNGKIAVIDLDQVVRIRTGERDEKALV